VWYYDVFGGGSATTTPIAPSTATEVGPGTVAILSIPKLNQAGGPNEGTPPAGFMWNLTQVALRLDWRADGVVNVVNLSCELGGCANFSFVNASSNVPLLFVGPDTTQVTASGVAGPVSGTAFASNSVPNGVNNFPGQSGSGNNTQNASNLSPYEGFGSGNFSASVTAQNQNYSGSSSDPGSAGKIFFGGNSTTGAILSVTYTYEAVAVPEPLTFGLMGSALVGLAMLVRRKRTVNQ